jgi:predicted transcriptional regulator of viral defense system
LDYAVKLQNLIKKNNGVISTKLVTEEGIPRTYLSEFVKKGKLERLERGIYIADDCYDDEMYRFQTKYAQAIFSHDTALFFHELTDRDPLKYSVTVKTGVNTKSLRKSGAKVYSIKQELYELGLTTAKTPYNRIVKTYDMERTICDIIRSRSQIDVEILTAALKRYANRKDKNLPQLMRYAEQFKIKNVLRQYLEILL